MEKQNDNGINFSLLITPQNLDEAIDSINRVIQGEIACNRELYASDEDGVCLIHAGPLSIYVTSVVREENEIVFVLDGKYIGFMLVEDDLFSRFTVEGVKVHDDGFVDYQEADICLDDVL